jgi:sugar phosphate isomerase/epimerase
VKSAPELGPHDLIAGYYTLAGSRAGAGEGEAARAPFEVRVAAASAAGYRGLGLLVDDYLALRASGRTDADLRTICEDHGVGVPEIEFLYHWTCTDERAAFARELEERLYRVADAFGARNLNMGDVNPPDEAPPLEFAAERFAAICDRAAEHGLLVALEFLPWSGIPDAETAWEIVRAADRPNGGINLDVWHHYRGAADDGMIRAIPPEAIVCVAISDADARVVGDLIEDTTRRRRLPGQGSFDLERFLRLLDEHGVTAPVTVEILSDEQNARPTAEAARVAIEATRTVMDRVGFRGHGVSSELADQG